MRTIFKVDTFHDAPLFIFRIPATRSLVTLVTATPGIRDPEAPLVTALLAMDPVTRDLTPDTTITPLRVQVAHPQDRELRHIIQVIRTDRNLST